MQFIHRTVHESYNPKLDVWEYKFTYPTILSSFVKPFDGLMMFMDRKWFNPMRWIEGKRYLKPCNELYMNGVISNGKVLYWKTPGQFFQLPWPT